MDRLDVGFKVLHAINPQPVYASGSGYGLSGPDRDNLAMDLTIQAVSGLISVTGFADMARFNDGRHETVTQRPFRAEELTAKVAEVLR